MALKRKVIGSFCKNKDPNKANYIKVKDGVTLLPNSYISLESKAFQLKKLDEALAAGKLSAEMVEKIKEKVNKMPDWVLAEAVQLVEG